jgi:hypothetical protein
VGQRNFTGLGIGVKTMSKCKKNGTEQAFLDKSKCEKNKTSCEKLEKNTSGGANNLDFKSKSKLKETISPHKTNIYYREIVFKNQSHSCKFFSHKNNRFVIFKSCLERDFILQLEFDPLVIEYKERPLKIEYFHNGEKYDFIPAFLVKFHFSLNNFHIKESILFEIKYQKEISFLSDENTTKFKSAKIFCQGKNWEFRVLTESEIRSPYLENARFLLNYRNYKYDTPEDFNLLITTLKELDHSTPEELILVSAQDRNKRAELIYLFWYMVANRYIMCDYSIPINMKSEIWANQIFYS